MLACCNSVSDCVESGRGGTPNITRLVSESSTDAIKPIIVYYLTQFAKLMEGKTKTQLSSTDIAIITDFIFNPSEGATHNLTIPDLRIFFLQVANGHYGEFYESITAAKICGYLRQYISERQDIAAMTFNNAKKASNGHADGKTDAKTTKLPYRIVDGRIEVLNENAIGPYRGVGSCKTIQEVRQYVAVKEYRRALAENERNKKSTNQLNEVIGNDFHEADSIMD